MKAFLHFVVLTVCAVVAIVVGVIVGDYGAWYFAWAIGTVMIVFVSVAGGVLFDTQERGKSQATRDVPFSNARCASPA